jgi:hypothetical protein
MGSDIAASLPIIDAVAVVKHAKTTAAKKDRLDIMALTNIVIRRTLNQVSSSYLTAPHY